MSASVPGDRPDRTWPRELGFRFEDSDSGDKVDVKWNNSTTTLFISIYAPCGRVPDEFVDSYYHFPEGAWHRDEQAAKP
ncbi:hypothetical protein J7E87_10220 [Streptomyces sp. ISL-1]|uniref:hypothetical protein n=1 Tax=Streptomyces sp. ISL-1 TaxID=2817657 RepID=UPI001BE961F1|nr:hypothetical protein [Streptomyces sp. ISL-1]MBT2389798.1 hypothetical protein [Streptomyces sp. ISL-1]